MKQETKMARTFLVMTSLVACSFAQRSPYAGKRPIGYPEMDTTTTTVDPLGNRFGEDVTTERLPIEALGDRDLVNRISKLPIDQQPFWYINWKALEQHRKNPQTYPQKETPFIENLSNQPSAQQNPMSGIPQGGFPQRFPQVNNPQGNLPQMENRMGGATNENKSGSLSQVNPANSHTDLLVDHIQNMPHSGAKRDVKQETQNSTNHGDIDHIIGKPHNETKRQTNYSQGNKAVQDFSKYFMKRN